MAVLDDMVSALAGDVQPTSPEAQLTDDQLKRAITTALVKFNPSLTVDDLPFLDEGQREIVLLGAASWCYWKLAAKFAEGMRIQIELDEFHGQQPYEHYIKLAEMAEEQFEEACGGANIEVSTLRRRSLRTGRIVPLAPGDTQ